MGSSVILPCMKDKLRPILHNIIRFTTLTITRWAAHRTTYFGAALAFYALFSLAPALAIIVSIAGAVFGFESAHVELVVLLSTLFGPEAGDLLSGAIERAVAPHGSGLQTIIGGAILLFSSTSMFSVMKVGIDTIWGSEYGNRTGLRYFLTTRLLGLITVVILALVIMLLLFANAALLLLNRGLLTLFPHAEDVVNVLLDVVIAVYVLRAGVLILLFALLFRLLPDISISWRAAWIGAVITVALFIIGQAGFTLYLRNTTLTNIYGAAGSLVAVLLWAFYTAQVFFIGAEFTYVLADHISGQTLGVHQPEEWSF